MTDETIKIPNTMYNKRTNKQKQKLVKYDMMISKVHEIPQKELRKGLTKNKMNTS